MDFKPQLAPSEWHDQKGGARNIKLIFDQWLKLTQQWIAKIRGSERVRPVLSEEYAKKGVNVVTRDCEQGLAHIFNISSGGIPAWTRNFLREQARGVYPALKCSDMRAFIEGRLTNGQRPMTGISIKDAKVQIVLHVLDVIATIVAHQEEQAMLKELDDGIQVPKRYRSPGQMPKPKPEPATEPEIQPTQEVPTTEPIETKDEPAQSYHFDCPNCGNEYDDLKPIESCPGCKYMVDPEVARLLAGVEDEPVDRVPMQL